MSNHQYSPRSHNNATNLFYQSASSSPVLEPVSHGRQNIIPQHKFYEDSSSVFVSPKLPPTTTQRKQISRPTQVRFKPNKKILNGGGSGPWEFNRIIKNQFKSNKDKPHWKSISKELRNTIMQLIEGDMNIAIDDIFQKYNNDLQSITYDRYDEINKIRGLKHKLMNQILAKINNKLIGSSLPDSLIDLDFDVEYVVAKRKYIQERYTEELKNVETLEFNLEREKQKLLEVKRILTDLKHTNNKTFHEKLLQNDLHPALLPAIQNAYGLIKTSNPSLDHVSNYNRDIADFNMVIPKESDFQTTNKEQIINKDSLSTSLPALTQYNNTVSKLDENVAKILNNENITNTLEFFSNNQ